MKILFVILMLLQTSCESVNVNVRPPMDPNSIEERNWEAWENERNRNGNV